MRSSTCTRMTSVAIGVVCDRAVADDGNVAQLGGGRGIHGAKPKSPGFRRFFVVSASRFGSFALGLK